MDSPKPTGPPTTALLSLLHHHFNRFAADFSTRLHDCRRLAGTLASNFPPITAAHPKRLRILPPPFLPLPFASIGEAKRVFDVALSSAHVAGTLAGTSVYTVSNTNNEFVLISDPNGAKSIGLLCFRREDAEAYLAQVQSRRRELRSQAKVVPITLDQVYMLKVEGIAFRFLPDPVQIKNALELKASNARSGFDGVPVFQSELLVVKKKNKRYCPIYFRKEDIEKELPLRGRGLSQNIVVGSLEDVLKKMEMSEKNSGWDDFIFIPPGKSHSQHIQEVAKA